jgi:hypothetical protein
MNLRMDVIGSAHLHTFDWIFAESAVGFNDWLRGNAGLFWINGKPGSGKSTLIKYILEDLRTQEALRDKYGSSFVVASFFFDGRGPDTQRSLNGLMRTILYQILVGIPELLSQVIQSDWELDDDFIWENSRLTRILHGIAKQDKVSGCIMLFVDALDECADDLREIARLLKDLSSQPQGQHLHIRICASSRPFNVFYDMFADSASLALHDWTYRDIRLYISDRLREFRGDGIEQLEAEIAHRAAGSFLWVELVTREILNSLTDGVPLSGLRSILSDIPEELSDLYRHIMRRINPERRSTAQRMIEFVLSREQPVTLIDFASSFNLQDTDSPPLNSAALEPFEALRRCHQAERQLRSFSGGLLEVTSGPHSTEDDLKQTSSPLTIPQLAFIRSEVRFIHSTAREFCRGFHFDGGPEGAYGHYEFLQPRSVRTPKI